MMKISVTPDNKKHIKAFDNTMLTAINTCPTMGILKYHHGKKFVVGKKSMALEAGTASHEYYAAVRLFQLGYVQGMMDHFEYQGKKLFGNLAGRWESMQAIVKDTVYGQRDWAVDALRFANEALHSTGFEDDPTDNKRTLAKIEEACMGYFDAWSWDRQEIYIADVNDPKCLVGVEIPFDLLVELDDGREYRFTGRMDGLHKVTGMDGKTFLRVEENKTAGRLGGTWSMPFEMANQITGYCIAGTAYAGEEVSVAKVLGMAIPRPRTGSDALTNLPIKRNAAHFGNWQRWFEHTTKIFEEFKDTPEAAPCYTHSCGRFFSTCAYMPLCVEPVERRLEIIKDEMVIEFWNPLD